MNNYICKIASINELIKRWDYLINIHMQDSKWIDYKDIAISNFKSNKTITYIGILNGNIICELTAYINSKYISDIKDASGLISDEMAYLCAFRTNKEYENKGYFSKLFKYALNDLKMRGFKSLSLGVEENETRNKEIYFHLGFNDYIKTIIDNNVIINFYKRDI